MNFNPIENRIVIKPDQAKEKTESGIYLPSASQEKPTFGEVVAVGPGLMNSEWNRVPMQIQVGDKVCYGKYNGAEVKIGDDEYIVMRESEVFFVTK